MIAWIAALADAQADVVDGDEAAEALRQALDLEHGLAGAVPGSASPAPGAPRRPGGERPRGLPLPSRRRNGRPELRPPARAELRPGERPVDQADEAARQRERDDQDDRPEDRVQSRSVVAG